MDTKYRMLDPAEEPCHRGLMSIGKDRLRSSSLDEEYAVGKEEVTHFTLVGGFGCNDGLRIALDVGVVQAGLLDCFGASMSSQAEEVEEHRKDFWHTHQQCPRIGQRDPSRIGQRR